MKYSTDQILGARESAIACGFSQPISDEVAIKFLDWYLPDCQAWYLFLNQDLDAAIARQRAFWQEHLGEVTA